MQKLIEIELKCTLQQVKPKWNVYHPSDHSGKPDICFGNHGIEIKTTKGHTVSHFSAYQNKFIEYTNAIWKVRYKKPTSNKVPYLFIKFSIINDELIFDEAYFGFVALTDYTVVKVKGIERELSISRKTVKKLCKKII